LVRRRCYEALQHQRNVPVDTVLAEASNESEPAARIAAANALALAMSRGNQDASLANRFDGEWVPVLQTEALANPSLNLRMRAVFALSRAGTQEADRALREISQTAEPRTAAVAERGRTLSSSISSLQP